MIQYKPASLEDLGDQLLLFLPNLQALPVKQKEHVLISFLFLFLFFVKEIGSDGIKTTASYITASMCITHSDNRFVVRTASCIHNARNCYCWPARSPPLMNEAPASLMHCLVQAAILAAQCHEPHPWKCLTMSQRGSSVLFKKMNKTVSKMIHQIIWLPQFNRLTNLVLSANQDNQGSTASWQ